jgi:GxxExxY protein
MELLHKELTEKILKKFFDVYNELGYGFLEKVYQNSLFIELKARGLHVEAQKQIKVYFKGKEVGDYYADLVVNDLIILELKAAECIVQEFESQLINYLRGTNIEVGILLNFGKKPEFIRKVFENSRKNLNSREKYVIENYCTRIQRI